DVIVTTLHIRDGNQLGVPLPSQVCDPTKKSMLNLLAEHGTGKKQKPGMHHFRVNRKADRARDSVVTKTVPYPQHPGLGSRVPVPQKTQVLTGPFAIGKIYEMCGMANEVKRWLLVKTVHGCGGNLELKRAQKLLQIKSAAGAVTADDTRSRQPIELRNQECRQSLESFGSKRHMSQTIAGNVERIGGGHVLEIRPGKHDVALLGTNRSRDLMLGDADVVVQKIHAVGAAPGWTDQQYKPHARYAIQHINELLSALAKNSHISLAVECAAFGKRHQF